MNFNKIEGNFWKEAPLYDAICITTNGIVIRNELVMGGGQALQAKQRYPWLPGVLGDKVTALGNIPHLIRFDPANKLLAPYIISFPTKEHFKASSPTTLIRTSAALIKKIADVRGLKNILTVPPGCGLGGRNWKEIEPLLHEAGWDSRFTVIDFPKTLPQKLYLQKNDIQQKKS